MCFARWPRLVLLFAAVLLGLAPAAAVVAGTCPSATADAAANAVTCDCHDNGCVQSAARLCGACTLAVLGSEPLALAPPPLPYDFGALGEPALLGQSLKPPVPPPESLAVR